METSSAGIGKPLGYRSMPCIVPVILAAGDSSRMGYPKALLPLGGETFLTHILSTLKAVEMPDARIVLGMHAAQIRPLLLGRPVRVLVNPDPARGQGSSMKLAAESLPPECEGCLIWPVDHPLISEDLLRRLVRAFKESAAPLAMPRCGGRAGHPAIFGRELIRDLLAAHPGLNLKPLVSRYKAGAAWLTTDESGAVDDVDTPDDYFRLTGETLESALSHRQRDDATDG